MFTRSRPNVGRQVAARRGIVLPLVAVSLILMLGMLSLALDVGWMMNTKDQLQNAADAAALSGAQSMVLGQDEATKAASEYTLLNRAGEQFAQLDPAVDVVFGSASYDDTAGVWSFTPNGSPTKAIQVTVRRTKSSPAGSLPLFFAGVLGRTVSNLSATATAISPPPRDMSFVVDISGSMWHDSSFFHLYTHPREGTNAPIAGLPINSFDAWVALSSLGEGQPFSTQAVDHIQYRTQAVFGSYRVYQIPTSFTGTPGQNGNSVYAGRSGPTWGIVGTANLPYGTNPDPATYSLEADLGLVFLPMGTFSFRPENKQIVDFGLSKVSSSTAPLHQNGDDTKSARGDLIGTLASPTVNGGLATVLNYLSGKGYSPEEQYLLRMPQDNSDLSPRNPGEKNTQEGTSTNHWQDRVATMLGLADWNSHLIHPAFLLPPGSPPSSTSPYSVSPSTAAAWKNELAQGDYSLRVTGPSNDPSPGTITLPYGKCLVSGATVGLDPAYYKWTGLDGLPNTADDVNVSKSVYKDSSDTGLPNGWFGADNAPYRITNVRFGIYFNHKTNSYEKRWKDPAPNQTDGSSFWVTKPFAIGAYHHWMTLTADPDLTPSAKGGNNQLADVTKTNYGNQYLTPEVELTIQDIFDFLSNPIFPLDDGHGGDTYPQQARMLQWRFGVKTFVEKMMQLGEYNRNERLPQAPVQPFQIERDIVFTFAQLLKASSDVSAQFGDQTGLITFAEDASVQNNMVDLTTNYDSLWSLDYLHNNNVAFGGQTTPLMAVMPQHTSNPLGTNVGAAIRRAMDQLTGKSSRPFTDKVIMLITDGRTNVTFKDTGQFDTTQNSLDFPRPIVGSLDAFNPSSYAIYAARFPGSSDGDLLTRTEAWNAIQKYGVKFFVLLVGNDADPFLAQWLADQSGGQWVWVRTSADIPNLAATFEKFVSTQHAFLIK